MQPYPTVIHSSNGTTLDLFTGIFYIIRIFGAGSGLIRPSTSSSSPNGGMYLEQDIFNDTVAPDTLWYFEPSSTPSFYEWGLYSEPKAKVTWTSGDGDLDGDFPVQLRNLTEIVQDIYDDPMSTFWDFESCSLENSQIGYKIRPMSLQNSVTFGSTPKSPRGWWLQINNKNPNQESNTDDRSNADHLLLFHPQNFKLYATTAHMDVGRLDNILNVQRVKEQVEFHVLENLSLNETIQKFSVSREIKYDLYVRPDQDLFEGLTIISPNTVPSRKYFDFEQMEGENADVLNLKASKNITSTEEIDMDPASSKKLTSFVTYLKEYEGIKYFSWADVSAVADMISNGKVVKNVLIKDLNLLKHLIRARGYEGEFYDLENKGDAAQIRIKTSGRVSGSFPFPFVQIEEM